MINFVEGAYICDDWINLREFYRATGISREICQTVPESEMLTDIKGPNAGRNPYPGYWYIYQRLAFEATVYVFKLDEFFDKEEIVGGRRTLVRNYVHFNEMDKIVQTQSSAFYICTITRTFSEHGMKMTLALHQPRVLTATLFYSRNGP